MQKVTFDEFINVDKPFGKILITGLEGYGKTLLLSAIAVKVMLNGMNDCFKSYDVVKRYNDLGFNFSTDYEHLCFVAFLEINCAGTDIPGRVSYDFDPFHFGLFCEDFDTDIYPPYASLFVPECQRVWPSYKAEQIRPEVYGNMETGRQAKFNLVMDCQRLMMVAKPVRDLCNRLKVPTAWKKLAVVSTKEHMRAGIFEKMSIPKKVDFLERNFFYLTELEIIAKADSKNLELSFSDIGKKMFNEINGNTVVLPNNEKAKQILHEKRIEWLKNFYINSQA